MRLPSGSVTEMCYVTADMKQATEQWASLAGAGPFYLMPMPETLYRSGDSQFTGRIKAALGFSGTTLVEFIEPLPDSPALFQEVLASKGEGALHHIMSNIQAITEDDFDRICAAYCEQGLAPVLEFEVPGQGRNTFFDARQQLGAYIEVLQVPAHALDMLDRMYAAHQAVGAKKAFQSIADLYA